MVAAAAVDRSGAWGYLTDPSGMLQLGARYYWPEVGRFVQQDPIRLGANHHYYADGNPMVKIDPDGLSAIATGLQCADYAKTAYDMKKYGDKAEAKNRIRQCFVGQRPYGHHHGPWAHPQDPKWQCWTAPRSEEEACSARTYLTCVRKRTRKGWGDWKCGRVQQVGRQL